MAARRRAVERAVSRRTAIDRVVAGMLVVVTAAGLMSVLPGASQRAVSRTTCQVVSLGLGACGDPGLDLSDTTLAPPRCRTLATLDSALPEVRVRRLTASRGLPVVVSTARSGDVYVQLGDAPQPAPPALLDGAARPQRRVSDGVAVPAQAEWLLPRGQGLDELVSAAQDGEHRFVQERSALALLSSVLDRDEREVPAPALRYSSVDLRTPRWPRLDEPVQPPSRKPGPSTTAGPARSSSQVTVRTDRPALGVYDRISQESAVVAPLGGTVGGRPATGTVRVTRDASGSIVDVLLAVVTQGQLVPGEPRTSLPGPAVAYVSVPVRTPAERELVGAWLAGPAAATLPLDEVLGLRAPQADDRLASFLTRAATVTLLRYALVEPAALQARVETELSSGRRQEWEGIRLVEAVGIAPTSSGTGRRPVADPPCQT